jgi:hypothetical protein
MKDSSLISDIKTNLEPYGINLLIAEHRIDIYYSVTEKIENMIKECDIALVLLTQNGIFSKFVDQEIGYIQSLKKPYIQLIQEGFEKDIVGFNYGRDYIPFNPSIPNEAIMKITNHLINYWNYLITEEQKRIFKLKQEEIKQQEEQKNKEMKILLGIFVGILTWGIVSNSN